MKQGRSETASSPLSFPFLTGKDLQQTKTAHSSCMICCERGLPHGGRSGGEKVWQLGGGGRLDLGELRQR